MVELNISEKANKRLDKLADERNESREEVVEHVIEHAAFRAKVKEVLLESCEDGKLSEHPSKLCKVLEKQHEIEH
jgi:predicted transcriptional regulator